MFRKNNQKQDMIVQRTKEGKAIARTNPYFKKRKTKKYSFNQNNRTR